MSVSEPNRSELPPSREDLAMAATLTLRPEEPSSQLVSLLDSYLAELQAGRQPDRAKLLAEHPELAGQLEQCLSGIEFIHRASGPATKSGMPTQLGDFRIVREVGRGGMGVVYEAEQISLKRRVALKVLRFGAASDIEAMQRFQREAETVAGLHHTNIVPIFAIGCEQGVNYYAMQFIEGRSLAEGQGLRGEGKRSDTLSSPSPLSPHPSTSVANWGLQAAEALAHAHQRGVIHRDIKPSNLILDPDGRIWLTDFGLAKRMDDVSLSMAGAILGTPRYMSPEQAAAAKQPVDHRTDIYSLGATLYELATGRPLFEADSPHAVITQILTTEPPAPRVLCPNLPRDFETIILKCLAKEPSQRYATAQALADDLRAFVEGRAIRARRATLAEQAARWFKQQKRSVGVAATAVSATVLVVIGSLIAWQMHAQSQLGYLTLKTPRDGNEHAEVAEVLTLDDKPVGSPFTLPTKEPLALPEGAYRLRLSAPSKVSQTYLFDVAAGTQQVHEVGLVNETVGDAISLKSPVGVVLIDQPERASVRLAADPREANAPRTTARTGASALRLIAGPQDPNKPTMRCYSANSQRGWKPDGTRETEVAPLWEADWRLEAPGIVSFLKLPEDKEAWKELTKQWDIAAWQQVLAWFNPYWLHNGTPPRVLQPMRDLNGDGIEDLIWVAPRLANQQPGAFGPGPLTPKAAVLVAASGKDGQPLWWFRPQDSAGGAAWLMTAPVWASDDVLVCVLRSVNSNETWLEAIRANSTESLWRVAVPSPDDAAILPSLRYAAELCVIPERAEASATRPLVVASVRRLLMGVDLATGEPAWPSHDFGDALGRPTRFVDLDGDDRPEVLAVVHPDGGDWQLAAMSLEDRRTLWHAPLTWFPNAEWPRSIWPDVVDLDDDGRGEVLLPNSEWRSGTFGTGVQVLDGASGQLKWSRWFPNSSHQRMRTQREPDQCITGPDLDGDGVRELFRASIRSEFRPRLAREGYSHQYEEHMLYVDCFSGSDGRSIWWQRVPLGLTEFAAMTGKIGEMIWWGGANAISRNALAFGSELGQTASGKPDPSAFRLIIPVHRHPDTQQDGGTHSIYVLSAATGRIEHQADDLAFPQLVDWNDDGLDDLAMFAPDEPLRFASKNYWPDKPSGKFVVLRGSPPEAFRRLDRWVEEQDFDGDGIAELSKRHDGSMGRMGDFAVLIASGRDGRLMSKWKTEWPETPRSFTVGDVQSFPPPLGDFDGDGRADLLVVRSEHFWEWEDDPSQIVKSGKVPLLIQAISSRTGKRAWGGGLLPLPEAFRPTDANTSSASWQAHRGNQVTVNWLDAVDLDGDQRPELLVALRLSGERFPRPSDGTDNRQQQEFLALVDGRDGAVRWSAAFTEWQPGDNYWLNNGTPLIANASADLNGDGTRDVVIVVPKRDFQGWWSGTLQARNGRDGELLWPAHEIEGRWIEARELKPPLIGDLDGDGRPEIVLFGTIQPQLQALRGDTGESLWTWKATQNLTQMTPSVVIVGAHSRRADGRQPSDDSQPVAKARGLTPTGSPTQRQVAVTINETGNQWELVLLDHTGQVVERVPCGTNQLWSRDLDGDGGEELLRYEGAKLTASRGLHEVLWTWTPPAEFGYVHVSRFDRTADGRAIVVASSGDSLTLLDGPTGKPLGRTFKSTNTSLTENNRSLDLNHVNLATPFENSRLLTRVGDGSVMLGHVVSRAVLPTDDDGRYRGVEETERTEGSGRAEKSSSGTLSSQRSLSSFPQRNDPRLVRQLPWAPTPAEWVAGKTGLLKQAALFVGLAFVVVLIPFWLVRAGVRRKELGWWRAALIAAGVAVCATSLAVFHVAPPGAIWRDVPWALPIAMGLAALPGLVWIATLTRNLITGEWRRLWWLLGGSLLAALVLATLALSLTASQKPPEQHYSWHAWWFILLFGAQSVGTLLVGWKLFGPGVLWVWRKFRKPRTPSSLKPVSS